MPEVTHILSDDENKLHAPATTQPNLFIAVPDTEDEDCSGCYFRNRKCPVTITGCSVCTPDMREDEKTIVWQVAP